MVAKLVRGGSAGDDFGEPGLPGESGPSGSATRIMVMEDRGYTQAAIKNHMADLVNQQDGQPKKLVDLGDGTYGKRPVRQAAPLPARHNDVTSAVRSTEPPLRAWRIQEAQVLATFGTGDTDAGTRWTCTSIRRRIAVRHGSTWDTSRNPPGPLRRSRRF